MDRMPPTGETGFEIFEAEKASLFELLCRSRAFWFGFAFWVGASLGVSVGFLWGMRAVVSW